MDLHSRDPDRLQRVRNGDRSVGIGCGIDDDGVEDAAGLLDPIHKGALVVGLEDLHLHAAGGRVRADLFAERGVSLMAVDLGLPHA